MAMRWLRIFNQLILTLLEARRFNTSPPAAVLIREDSLCPPLLKCILEAALRRVCLVFLRCLFYIRHARSERLDHGAARLSRERERCHKEKEEERAAGKPPAVAGEGLFSKQHLVNFIGKQRFSSGLGKTAQGLWAGIPLFTLGPFHDSLKRLHEASIPSSLTVFS